VTNRLMEILDRDAAIMRVKTAEVMPAADGEARQARELMILLHTFRHSEGRGKHRRRVARVRRADPRQDPDYQTVAAEIIL
jgi:hypothetical protein